MHHCCSYYFHAEFSLVGISASLMPEIYSGMLNFVMSCVYWMLKNECLVLLDAEKLLSQCL